MSLPMIGLNVRANGSYTAVVTPKDLSKLSDQNLYGRNNGDFAPLSSITVSFSPTTMHPILVNTGTSSSKLFVMLALLVLVDDKPAFWHYTTTGVWTYTFINRSDNIPVSCGLVYPSSIQFKPWPSELSQVSYTGTYPSGNTWFVSASNSESIDFSGPLNTIPTFNIPDTVVNLDFRSTSVNSLQIQHEDGSSETISTSTGSNIVTFQPGDTLKIGTKPNPMLTLTTDKTNPPTITGGLTPTE